MARMIDIAQRAGVSQTTVSFVLNNRSDAARISEETRNRVLGAARELGYSTNHLARAMRTGNTRMIGFLGGELTNEPVGAMLSGAIEEAARVGYTMKVLRLGVPGLEWHQLIGRIAEWRLSGVIALHLPHDMLEELWHDARSGSTPLVLLDSRIPVTELPQVVSDDEAGVKTAIEHLVQLGHRRIAFLSGDESSTLTVCREQAFSQQMKIRWPEVKVVIERGSFSDHQQTLEIARTLLQKPAAERVTAIMCGGDVIAMSVLQVAAQLNLRVPRDFSLIGFANTQAAAYSTPPLTSVEQPFAEMGRIAVQRLIRLAGDGKVLDENSSNNAANSVQEISYAEQHATVYLPTRLVERSSTAPPLNILDNRSNSRISALEKGFVAVAENSIDATTVKISS